MNRLKNIVFSIFFCILLLSIPITQLFVDLKEVKRIRVADIIVDTFVIPVKRVNNIYKNYRRIISYISILKEKQQNLSDSIVTTLDSIESLIFEVKNNIIRVNHFISDSQNNKIQLTDSLLNVVNTLKFTKDRYSFESNIKKLSSLSTIIDNELKKEKIFFTSIIKILNAFTKETFFNKKYLRDFEKELENSSPITREGRKIIQLIRYFIFDEYGEKIIKKREWFFYKPDVNYLYRPSIIDNRYKRLDFNDESVKDDPLEAILDFKNQLENRGIDLLVVIVPVKAGIYPQFLNKKIKADDKNLISPTHSIIEELKKAKVNVVDLYDVFLEAKKEDSFYGDSLYLRKDTHWKSRAIKVAAKKVAEEIKKYPWFTERNSKYNYTIDTVYAYRKGDIVSMADFFKVKLFKTEEIFKTETTKCLQVIYYNDINKKSIYRDDFKNSRILLLGDSFSRIYQTDPPSGAGFIAHVAYELSEPLYSVVSDGGASTIVREKLSRNSTLLNGKKIVIWEFVERDLRFGAEGWKKIKIF